MGYSWGVGVSTARADDEPVVRPLAAVRDLRPTPPPGDLGQFAVELSLMVDVWKRLLVQHVPDRGGRCVVCTKGGTGLPSTPWPCSIHAIADMARRRHDEARPDRSAG